MIDLLTVEQQWQDLASGNLFGAVLPAHPFQVLSLWDMLRFEARWFYHSSLTLDRVICELGKEINQREATARMTKDEAEAVTNAIHSFDMYVQRLGLKRTQERIDDISMHVETMPGHLYATLGRIHFMLLELRTQIARDLSEQVFMALRPPDVAYYEQEQLFESAVFNNFPSARHDVAEAGNCYATGRYTACVFHCMRALEKGLRALVHELNDKHAAGIVFSGPVDEANWGSLIGEIQIALENPKRQKRLNPLPNKDEMGFYSKLSLEFEYFKNAWRDDVSHSRSNYDENEAKSVMNHVEAFMKQIAKRLTEQPSEADNPLPEN